MKRHAQYCSSLANRNLRLLVLFLALCLPLLQIAGFVHALSHDVHFSLNGKWTKDQRVQHTEVCNVCLSFLAIGSGFLPSVFKDAQNIKPLAITAFSKFIELDRIVRLEAYRSRAPPFDFL